MSGEQSLIDTNVLVYAADESSPQHAAARKLRDAGGRGEIALCIAPQVILEYVSIVTNPKRVSTVSSIAGAWTDAERYLAAFPLIRPGSAHVEHVVALAKSLGIGRAEVYDLALAVTMLDAGVTTVYTYDPTVFSRVPGVGVRKP